MPEEFNLEFPDSNPQPEIQTQQQEAPFESVAQGFLKNVAEQDRPIVEKYVKDWDRGVSTRFQKLHETYQPYKDLGDIEQIKVAMQLQAMIDEDPVGFGQRYFQAMQQLQEQGLVDPFDFDGNDQDPVEEPNGGQQPGQYNNDPQLMERLSNLEQMLQQFGTTYQQDVASRQEQAELQQLDDYMAQLHNTHGRFNDDYVLLMMSRGMDGAEAVKAWKTEIQQELGASKPTPPKLFGGGGVPGQPELDLKDKKTRLAYMAQMAREAND